jgi:hypothetical protein
MAFSEVFFTFLISSVVGFSLTALRLLYNSKIRELKCCGFWCLRDIVEEEVVNVQNESKEETGDRVNSSDVQYKNIYPLKHTPLEQV